MKRRAANRRVGSIRGITPLLAAIQWGERGLVPAVIQDERTKQVLTLCYLNRAALTKSLATGTVYVFRRSQHRLMQKGETSGHIQVIRRVLVDCEGKSLVLIVRQRVAACHAGYFTCYFRQLTPAGELKTMGAQAFDPAKVYKKA